MQAFKRKTDNVCCTKLPASVFAGTTKQSVSYQLPDDGLQKFVKRFRSCHMKGLSEEVFKMPVKRNSDRGTFWRRFVKIG